MTDFEISIYIQSPFFLFNSWSPEHMSSQCKRGHPIYWRHDDATRDGAFGVRFVWNECNWWHRTKRQGAKRLFDIHYLACTQWSTVVCVQTSVMFISVSVIVWCGSQTLYVPSDVSWSRRDGEEFLTNRPSGSFNNRLQKYLHRTIPESSTHEVSTKLERQCWHWHSHRQRQH